MNRFQLCYAMIALSIGGCIALATLFTFVEKKWTVVKTQLVVMFGGYIGLTLSSAIFYYYRDVLAAKVTGNVLSSFFLAVMGIASIHHSWTRAESIMQFKNQLAHQICKYFVWFCPLFLFLPTVILCFSTVIDTSLIGPLATNFSGIMSFHFDMYILYNFATFFYDKTKQNKIKPMIIVKHGIASILLFVICSMAYPLFFILGDDGAGDAPGNVFMVITMGFLLFSCCSLIKMKWELKKETSKNLKSSEKTPLGKLTSTGSQLPVPKLEPISLGYELNK